MATIYLQAENLSKSFGDLTIFRDISLSLFQYQRTAIIAKNGTGKSTLLNILTGKDSPDTGKVTLRNDVKVGYLAQNPDLNEKATILENVFGADDEISTTIRNYEKALAKNDKDLLHHAMEAMDRLNIWEREVKAKQILSKLRIENINQPVAQLSGGQRKRVALAAALISEPDVLILDEPTNHLDLDMVEWLEEFLTRGQQTILMVTHDRYFLDRVCTDIIEIDGQIVYNYKGNYSYFLDKREERINAFTSEVDKATNLLRRETEWMRRMPQARGTKAKYRIDAYYKLKDVASQRLDTSEVEINVSTSRLGKKIMEVKNLNKSFGSKVIMKDFSYTFNRFEKLGIIGENGTGKTTFLNLITGAISADSGEVDAGSTLVVGYYRQEGMNIDNNKKVIDVAREIADVVTLGDGKTLTISQFLNMFLFSPEKQHTYVYKLSGGEKRRLYLLTILMRNPNFLILDEPTNDLDIHTLNILEDYLKSFPGVVIVVSHDRFFMDKVVDGLLVFEGDGEISGFPGSYTEYRTWAMEEEKNKPKEKSPEKPIKQEQPKTQAKKKLTFAQKKELEQLSKDIEQLEKEKTELESQLSSGNLNPQQLQEKSNRYQEITQILEGKEFRWLELSEIEE
ncbi:ABC transporter ATP-binding protein [Tenuifilaceae bacterium CYCD]|nr:ABC transporter ATP-binding protein [Tenuifilaceae bacterium CYCD]